MAFISSPSPYPQLSLAPLPHFMKIKQTWSQKKFKNEPKTKNFQKFNENFFCSHEELNSPSTMLRWITFSTNTSKDCKINLIRARVGDKQTREIKFPKSPPSMCTLMKNLSNAKQRKKKRFTPGKRAFVDRQRHQQRQWECEQEKRSFALENAFIAAIFLSLYWLFFCEAGLELDLRVLIEVTRPRRLCHKKGANFIMSGYKYFSFSLRPATTTSPPFYVYLYWAHKSNGKTWIWMGKMLRAIYGEKHEHGRFMVAVVERDVWRVRQGRCPNLLYQFISN